MSQATQILYYHAFKFNTTDLLDITCTLAATGMILRRLENWLLRETEHVDFRAETRQRHKHNKLHGMDLNPPLT